jgi:heme exporter protein A
MRLVAENLVVTRGLRTIIDGLSFAVSAGEALMLTGPNGAGKTTLLRAIAGFLPPASGRVHLTGGIEERTIAEECHFVGHQNGIKAQLTVAENLSFWGAYLCSSPAGTTGLEDRVAVALDRFGLEPLAGIPAAYLSAGQKRRAGLARLLVSERPIWLLDEPTASLDTDSAAIMTSVASAHLARGGLLLAATHLPLGLAGARELRLGAAALPAQSTHGPHDERATDGEGATP